MCSIKGFHLLLWDLKSFVLKSRAQNFKRGFPWPFPFWKCCKIGVSVITQPKGSEPALRVQLLPGFFSGDSVSNMGPLWGTEKGGGGRMFSATSCSSCCSCRDGSAFHASDGRPAAELTVSASGGFSICSLVLVLLIEDTCTQTWRRTFSENHIMRIRFSLACISITIIIKVHTVHLLSNATCWLNFLLT